MKGLLFVLMLMASMQGFAQESGGQDGNGGFGIRCGKDLYTLDLYEAKNRYGYTVDLGAPNLSVKEKVEIMLDRLDRLQPFYAKFYKAEAKKLFHAIDIGIAFLDGKALVINNRAIIHESPSNSLDVGLSLLCPNVRFVPIARNYKTPDENDQEIFIFRDQYDKLDNNNKAAILMHELIYMNQFNMIKTKTSSRARSLVALLASKEADTMTFEEFITFGKSLDLIALDLRPKGIPWILKTYFSGFDDIKFNFDSEGRITKIEGLMSVQHVTFDFVNFIPSVVKFQYKDDKFVSFITNGFMRDLPKNYIPNGTVFSQSLYKYSSNGKLLCGYVVPTNLPLRVKFVIDNVVSYQDLNGNVYISFDDNEVPNGYCDPQSLEQN